jgi:hypothetical protein
VIERWGRLDVLVNNAGAGAASNRLLLFRFQLAVQRPNRRCEWLILSNHSRATAQALGIVSEGLSPVLGPQNLIDLHPVLQFQLKTNVTGAFAWNWYWSESTHDGLYVFGSGILIDPSHARYLGSQGDLEIRWTPKTHIIIASTLRA